MNLKRVTYWLTLACWAAIIGLWIVAAVTGRIASVPAGELKFVAVLTVVATGGVAYTVWDERWRAGEVDI